MIVCLVRLLSYSDMSWLLILTLVAITPHVALLQTYHFYTHQKQVIPLGRNVVRVEIKQGACKFQAASPSMMLVSSVSVTNPKGSQLSREEEVFQRIRNLESQTANFFAEFDDYILIIRGHNNIIILSKASMKLVNEYAISELSNISTIMPFQTTSAVLILSQGKMFRCDRSAYSILGYNGTVKPAVSINETAFAVTAVNSIEVYDVVANKSIKLRRIINQEDARRLQKNVALEGLQFSVCKYRQDTLYCLCRNNGLFLIDPNKMTILSLIKKENCIDFIATNNNIYFQCEFYQDFFISSYPDTHILSFFPSFVKSMTMFEQQMLLFQHNSKLTFWYINDPSKEKEIDLQDHIIQNGVIRNNEQTHILVLFKAEINKYEYTVTNPQLVCYSQHPLSQNITFEVEVGDGTKISKQIHLEVVNESKSISPVIIVVLLMMIAGCFLVMVAVICYYQKMERNLRGVYNYMRRLRNNNGVAVV